MTITVIIVNYNSGIWLRRAIRSVLDYSDAAVVVVDNNSQDGSLNKAREMFTDSSCQRIRWLENDSNAGFARANNQVLSEVDSEYAVLMNPDCILHEGTLQHMLQWFVRYPRMGLASCRIVNGDGTIQASYKRRYPTPGSSLVRMLCLQRLFPRSSSFADFDTGSEIASEKDVDFVEAVSGAFMMVRCSAMQSVGLLDEGYFMHCEDLDWCWRFNASGFRVGSVTHATVTHIKGVCSTTRPIRVQYSLSCGMYRFFSKFYASEMSLPMRWLVCIGIIVRFILKATQLSIIKICKRRKR